MSCGRRWRPGRERTELSQNAHWLPISEKLLCGEHRPPTLPLPLKARKTPVWISPSWGPWCLEVFPCGSHTGLPSSCSPSLPTMPDSNRGSSSSPHPLQLHTLT